MIVGDHTINSAKTRPVERPRSIVDFFERPRSRGNIKKVSVDAYLNYNSSERRLNLRMLRMTK